MADGRLNICKDCTMKRVHRHRQANIDRIQQYDRARSQKQDRRESNRARSIEYNAVNRLKRYARAAVQYALRSGKLFKGACEVTNCVRATEAHHDDYFKPLEVRWLCKQHHEDLHHGPAAERV